MSAAGQKRTLDDEPIDNSDDEFADEFDDEFDDNDHTGWGDTCIIEYDENEPLLKQRKLCTVADDDGVLQMNINTNNSNDSNLCSCIILISGSVTTAELFNSVFKQLQENQFQIGGIDNIKQFSLTHDELQQLFFESPNSSINIGEIAAIGLFDEFNNNKSNYVIVIKGIQNKIISYAKKYKKNAKFYFTLNDEDFKFKFNALFSTRAQDNTFWEQTIKKSNSSMLSQNHSPQIENMMNKFFESIKLDKEIENYSQKIKCCCWPIAMSQHEKYGAKYRKLIKEIGINKLSKDWFKKAIQRNINIYNGQYFDIKQPMDIIYIYMGVVIKNDKCDKEISKNLTCGMCENEFVNLKAV